MPAAIISRERSGKFGVIGAGGVIGLSTMLNLLEQRQEVTGYEAAADVGMGTSFRPDFMERAGTHTGLLFTDWDTSRTHHCTNMHRALEDPKKLPTLAMQILLANSLKVGKYVSANDDASYARLIAIHKRARSSDVWHIVKPELIEGSTELARRNPFFDANPARAALYFPQFYIVHLGNCMREMRDKINEMGGAIHYNHRVTGFVVGSDGGNGKCGTGILLQDVGDTSGRERQEFFETAINTAGIFAKSIAEMGNRALCDQAAGMPIVMSAVPVNQVDKVLSGLVFKDPFAFNTLAPVYPAINIKDDGSSLGPHSYRGAFVDPGKPELGGYGVVGTNSHIISLNGQVAPFNPDINFGNLPAEMIAQVENFIPNFDPSWVTEKKLSITSQIFRPKDPRQPNGEMVRDFYAGAAVCVERHFGLFNGYFNDTPGGSTWASVGRGTANGAIILNRTPSNHALAVNEALYPRLRFNVAFG